MNPLHFLHCLKDRKQHRADHRPSDASVALNLEVLEDRWLPSGTLPTAPPSFVQAAVSLYIGGIQQEAVWQINVTAFKEDFVTGSKAERVLQFFGNSDLNSIEANIAFNMPYAGPFGPLFVLAGAQALDQFLHH